MPDLTLPTLLAASNKSKFRLRVLAAAWSSECGGAVRSHATERDGLLVLSAAGPDTAVKAIRALLYQPDLECEFMLESDEGTTRLARATFDGAPVKYDAKVAKLAPGAVHIVALAKVPGLMPRLDDDCLWAELNGPQYTTPLLRPWTG